MGEKMLWLLAGLVIAVLLLVWAWSASLPTYSGFGVMGMGMMAFGLIFWVALLVVVLYVALGGKGKKNALEIVKERFARGEISRKEFEEKKKLLQAS